MTEKIKSFLITILEVFKDKIFIYLTLADILLLAVFWFFWVRTIVPSGLQVYSPFIISSSESFAPFNLPIIVSLFFVVNLALGAISRKREALASYLALGSSLFVICLALVLLRHYLSLI